MGIVVGFTSAVSTGGNEIPNIFEQMWPVEVHLEGSTGSLDSRVAGGGCFVEIAQQEGLQLRIVGYVYSIAAVFQQV
jgi:hypothetical protein